MNLGPSEILLIVVLGILLFGPEKLPSIARELGRMYAQAYKALRQLQEAFYAPLKESEGRVREVVEDVKREVDSIKGQVATAPTSGENVNSECKSCRENGLDREK